MVQYYNFVYVLLNPLLVVRKQSIEDVKRLFSKTLVEWMDKKGYESEARHLSVVHNWRHACDERGLPTTLCSQFNVNFLANILDELMPWHADEGLNDYSLLEVNQ